MQDWKVAVLVVIIVVFVVLASLMIFLIYRFGNWRRVLHRKKKSTTLRYIDDVEENVIRNNLQDNFAETSDMYLRLFLHDPRLRPSPHTLYFIDFQGELLSLDFKKKPLHHIKSEVDLQHYLFNAFHPTIEEGHRVVTVTPEMLALAYVDEREALVVMDLNRLLERDAEFGARLTHTAERPLLLARLVPDGVDGAVYTTLTRFGYTVGAPPPLPPSRQGGAEQAYYLNAAPGQQTQQQRHAIEVDVAQSRGNPMALATPTTAAVPPPLPTAPMYLPPSMSFPVPSSVPYTPRPTAAPAGVNNSASIYTADAPGMAPTPLIHPCDTHHITTSTPITVTAATYTVLHRSGARTTLDAAATAALEAARLRWDRRQSLVVSLTSGLLAGYQCVIDPVTENGNVISSRGGVAEPLVCLRADALQYTVERVNSTQWLPVERPFYLPAGRWCVRARAVLYSDDSTKSTAKVFTVNVM